MTEVTQSRGSPGYEPQTQSLTGKTVVVTGGTTGIGRATARLLAARGARVLIFGRHEEELNEALEDIRGTGGEVHGLTADQAREEDVRRVFEVADETLGELDILINNAAISPDSLLEIEPDDLRYALDTNLFGPLACAREAARRMQERREGHIVNIGSIAPTCARRSTASTSRPRRRCRPSRKRCARLSTRRGSRSRWSSRARSRPTWSGCRKRRSRRRRKSWRCSGRRTSPSESTSA